MVGEDGDFPEAEEVNQIGQDADANKYDVEDLAALGSGVYQVD
jgi:hypothetical protein